MEHLKRGQTWQITASNREQSYRKREQNHKQNPTDPQTKYKLIRQATRTRLKLVKQEPCQVSKVRPKNTKTGKNKYIKIVKQHFTNIKKASIVFHMATNKAIPKAILN